MEIIHWKEAYEVGNDHIDMEYPGYEEHLALHTIGED